MRMLDCKEQNCQSALVDAPKLIDYLGPECRDHFEKVQSYLRDLDIPFVIDPKLVRGFDYYTKTAFEFVSGKLGAQNALGGGGRYDNLVEEIGGSPTPAVGFGLGLERLMLTLESLGIELPVEMGITAFIASMGEKAHTAAVKLAYELRNKGISVDMDYTGRSLKAQMKIADKLGAKYAIILGEDELARQAATVRNMASSEQRTVSLSELADILA